jgi:TatD DNase family protein
MDDIPVMPPAIFDTHCHLAAPELFHQHERILAEAREAGVSQILTVACQPEEFEPAITLAGRDGLHVATAIHPHEAAKSQEQDWAALSATWRRPEVVAAGEMGLDYHYDFSPRDVQRAVFERQLDLAAQADFPVIIHCREAQANVIAILAGHGFERRPVVFHCFSGTPEEAAEIRAHGWWTSFTGVITFKNTDTLRQVVLETPADQLMFETDSPYLSPEPVRRMRPNEPKNLVHTIRFAAQLRGEAFEELAARSTANALRFFRL